MDSNVEASSGLSIDAFFGWLCQRISARAGTLSGLRSLGGRQACDQAFAPEVELGIQNAAHPL